MSIVIIGIDCATQPNKVGLARAVFDQGRLHIQQAELGSAQKGIAARVAEWLPPDAKALIAVDAPLGWPTALGTILATHQAGNRITQEPNQIFRRETDRFIKRKIGKQSLDVGADRIARTAAAALTILDELRCISKQTIPLTWLPTLNETGAIEVYPAGTLLSYGLPASSYKDKKPMHREIREQILRSLPKHVVVDNQEPLLNNADVLDAALCCLAGADFLSGLAMRPEDQELAEKEGWIWVKSANG